MQQRGRPQRRQKQSAQAKKTLLAWSPVLIYLGKPLLSGIAAQYHDAPAELRETRAWLATQITAPQPHILERNDMATAKKAAPAKKASAAKTAAPAVKRTPNAAFMKAVTPSAQLAAVIGDKPMPRTEVTKKIWEYIKKNNLQDQAKKTMINADAKLKEIFKADQVTMFEMTKLISAHLK